MSSRLHDFSGAGQAQRSRKFTLIIVAYPLVLTLVALGVNLWLFGVAPAVVSLPAPAMFQALVASGVLLLVNHTWLMTATELTRLNHKIYASPEEWDANGARKEDVSGQGWVDLERHHNAHRNATENTVYFAILAIAMSMVSPTELAAQTWFGFFAAGRLGYTYSALRGNTALRGLFMSISLLALYGLGSYLGLSLMP